MVWQTKWLLKQLNVPLLLFSGVINNITKDESYLEKLVKFEALTEVELYIRKTYVKKVTFEMAKITKMEQDLKSIFWNWKN